MLSRREMAAVMLAGAAASQILLRTRARAAEAPVPRRQNPPTEPVKGKPDDSGVIEPATG